MSIIRLRNVKGGKARSSFVPPPEEGQVRLLRLHRRLAAFGALLGLALGVIAFLPASLVANAISGATNDRLLFAEAEGTVWNGSALPVLTGGAGSRDASVLPSRLEWRLRPHFNGLALHLAQDCCLPHGVDIGIHRGLDGWVVKVDGPADSRGPAPTPAVAQPRAAGGAAVALGNATETARTLADALPIGQWPMGWLEGIGFPWNTIHPGGLLMLTTHDLSFTLKGGQWRTLGASQIEIRQASSRLSSLDTLGTYRMLIEADPSTEQKPGEGGTRALVWLSTVDGSLLIDGRGLIGSNGFRLRAEAKAAPGSESALNNLLNLIGRRNGALSVISIG